MPKVRLSHLGPLQVLELVRTHGAISRAQVTENTGTSSFLASRICDSLLAAGFISEAGHGDSTGGRRPTLLSLRSEFGRLIGVHLGTVNVRIALTDFRGHLLDYCKGQKSRHQRS